MSHALLLRASSIHSGEAFDVRGLTSDEPRPVGVVGEEALIRFADSAVYRDEAALAEAREALELRFGAEALVDAAATVASFQRLNRVADGCGIALDRGATLITGGLQRELGIDHFVSAANTPKPGMLKQLLGLLMRPLDSVMLRAMQKGVQKAEARRREADG